MRSHVRRALGDLSPRAKRHVPAKRLLRSHVAIALGLDSMREEIYSIEKVLAISCYPPKYIVFMCGCQVQFL